MFRTHQNLVKSFWVCSHFYASDKPKNAQHWTSLKLQEKPALLQCADPSVSHSVLTNPSLSEDILIITIKAQLQSLPTEYNLAIWYPTKHSQHCILHPTQQDKESIAHILNCTVKTVWLI